MLNKFVFMFAIPAMVFRGLAKQNFETYEAQGFWDFVLVFLVVATSTSVLAAVAAWVSERSRAAQDRDFPGVFLRHYSATTLTSTIVFGNPIVVALYGPGAEVCLFLSSLTHTSTSHLIIFLIFCARSIQCWQQCRHLFSSCR